MVRLRVLPHLRAGFLRSCKITATAVTRQMCSRVKVAAAASTSSAALQGSEARAHSGSFINENKLFRGVSCSDVFSIAAPPPGISFHRPCGELHRHHLPIYHFRRERCRYCKYRQCSTYKLAGVVRKGTAVLVRQKPSRGRLPAFL